MQKLKLILLLALIHTTFCFAEAPEGSQTEKGEFSGLLNEFHTDTTDLRPGSQSFILKISPVHILAGDFITNSFSAGLSFERPIKKAYSMQVGARYIFTDKRDFFNKKWVMINVAQVNGFALDAELRKYMSKGKAEMSGGYLSTLVKSKYTQATYQEALVNRFSVGAFINIGWQEIFDSGIVFDISIGAGVKYVTANTSESNSHFHLSYHIMDGSKKPYHTDSALFPFINLGLNLGYSAVK